jgi:hypothetical protein
MKAASEFVLMLLVIVIIVTSITVLWLYFYGFFKFIAKSGENSDLGEALSSCMKIDSVRGDKIYLKNCGTGVIKNDTLAVFVDEQSFSYSMSSSSLAEGEVGTVTLNLSSVNLGGRRLKITTKAAEVERYVNVTLVSGNKSMNLLELV